MADYNFKGFKDYIKLLEPIQPIDKTVEETQIPPAGQPDTVLAHDPILARIVDLASYRK